MRDGNATTVLSIRVSPSERALIEAAARRAHTSVSDFMRSKALQAAEDDVLRRSNVTIPAADWEAFETWASRPAEAVPALRELFRRDPTWRG